MIATSYTSAYRINLSKPMLWAVFGLYVVLLSYTVAHHELWGDELQAWNIAKASASFPDLLVNTRFEGHPPAWFALLWAISKYTHNLAYVQAAQVVIACTVVFLVIFFAPFPLLTRLLIPFGYYFLFEYGVFSRNYMIGVLPAFCICLIMRKNFRYKTLLYYALLLLMACTHLLAIPVAAGLHVYYLGMLIGQRQKTATVALHTLLGIVAFLPAAYFIFPPSDSQINVRFWIDRWNVHQLTAFIQAPLQAFIPMPAWWHYQFWNTEVFTEAKNNHSLFRLLNWPISIATVAAAIYVLKRNRNSLLMFVTCFLLTFIIAVAVFPLSSARYAGFIFIGFMAAYWLYCYEALPSRVGQWLVNGLLMVQLAGGIFAVSKDIRFPFSNLYRVNELLQDVPPGKRAVCDYWSLNSIASFAGKPFYCVDLQKQVSFILWGSDLAAMQKNPNRYYDGVHRLFQKEGIKELYMISTGTLQNLNRVDSLFLRSYHVELVDKKAGAIEKGSNLYLYLIKDI